MGEKNLWVRDECREDNGLESKINDQTVGKGRGAF